MRRLAALPPQVAFPAFPILHHAALMPGDGVPNRHEDPATDVCPIDELRVLVAPADERLVEAAEQLEEAAADPHLSRPHEPEQIVIRRRHVAGAGHVGFDPVRVGLPAGEQVPQRTDSVPDRRGVHPIHFHLRVKPRRHRVGDRMVPTGVGRQTLRLQQHVAVEKDENVMGGKPRARVPGPGQTEAAMLLPHHPYVERRPGGRLGRDARSVVDDDYLEPVRGQGLPLQSRQGQCQRLRGLVVRHDHAQRPGRSKSVPRNDVQLAPVVVPDCRRSRQGGHQAEVVGMERRPGKRAPANRIGPGAPREAPPSRER